MTKRIPRKSLALVAAGLLASPFVAQTVADAQTVTSPSISLSAVSTGGTVPAGVSGVNVTVSCSGLLNATNPNGTSTTQTYTVAFGAAAVPTYWPLTAPVSGGSNGSICTYGAQLVGTSGLTSGSIAIKVGETARTVNQTQSVGSSTIATSKATLAVTATQPGEVGTAPINTDPIRTTAALYAGTTVGVLPTQISTAVVITVTFPGITVKKVVNGDEPVAGYAYPMSLSCVNGIAFIEASATSLYSVGSLFAGGTGNFLTLASGALAYDAGPTASPAALPAGSPAGSFVGTVANVAANLAAVQAAIAALVVAPLGVTASGSFTGAFTLVGGKDRVFGVNEFPALRGTGFCTVTETGSQGAALAYSSTRPPLLDGTAQLPLPGALNGTTFQSAATSMGQTVTVTNSFLGNLVISKVVTGDPKTNIATYEISVACDKGGPKDTFLLKDRQSKVYSNLVAGTNCLITETRSDGAVASYSDNSGDNTTDGRVTIKRVASCGSASTVGAPTVALPGGPATPVQVSTVDNCDASVIVTNSYNVVETTTVAPTTVAPTTTAAPTTAAPAVTPAPATPVEAEPTFTG